MTTFDKTYQNILRDIYTKGIRETSAQQKVETAALPGIHFSHDIEKDGFPILTLRKVPLKMFIVEQIWFLSGARKPDDFLRDYTKIWDPFTNPNDVVTAAYGYRWRKHFGRDQIKMLLELLQKEPLSRHGVVLMWDPSSDGLSTIKKANVPCPYTFTVNIIGGRLHLHLIIRSNDMYLGAPTDIAGFALLQCILAQKLNVKPGIYSHSISNAHVYQNQYGAVEELLKRDNDHKKIVLTLPKNAFERAEKKDTTLVEEIFANLDPQYKPLDAIQGVKIVTWNEYRDKTNIKKKK
jgi:thymidylate synthase